MKTKSRLSLALASFALASGLAGCGEKGSNAQITAEKVPEEVSNGYFSKVPSISDPVSVVGDFNNDGNLDVVITAVEKGGFSQYACSYIYLGDGQGNFTLKPNKKMTTEY